MAARTELSELVEALALADRAILVGLVLASDMPAGDRFVACVEDLSQLLDRFAGVMRRAGLPNAAAATENACRLREVVDYLARPRRGRRRHLAVVRGG